MADDPYQVLGLARDAGAEDIRRAYRKLAKQHHPDLNPGDKGAEDRFKSVSSAHELLSDPDKRAQFDRGEIDGAGQPRAAPNQPRGASGAGGASPFGAGARRTYRDFAEEAGGARYRAGGGGFSEADLGDIFGDLFGAGGRAEGRGPSGGPRRGRDLQYGLTVAFLDAVNGAAKRLQLPDGRTLEVKIPAGLEDGQVLRLRGQGEPGADTGGTSGAGSGLAGDALIEVHVQPHPHFRRVGSDIHLDLPVTIREAVLGGRISVPTPGGVVTMTIPAHAETGQQLRLRGRGVPAHGDRVAGDLYATLRVMIGAPDAALEAFLRDWQPARQADPRRDMMGAA